MVDGRHICEFFRLLNKEALKYVLIKNDGNLIPHHVEDEKDIDILIHPSEYDRFLEVINYNLFQRLDGESKKYYFAYKLRPDIYAKKDDLFIHAYDMLACTSLTNMGICKLPLHQEIQLDIWKNKIWDNHNNWWIMDDCSILIYLLTKSIFDKRMFRQIYKEEIIARKHILRSPDFLRKIEHIFFKFSSTLIGMLENDDYENILMVYTSFTNY